MQWLMLSCRKATELIEKKLLVKLSSREKIQLKLHKSFCDACTAYEKQSKLIEKLLSKHIHEDDGEIKNNEVVENEKLKKRILEKIK